LKHLKFWYPTRFQYEEFNESEKLKFKNHLIYIFRAKFTEIFRELKNTVDLLIYIYSYHFIKMIETNIMGLEREINNLI
jgi:hypothetical protein